MKYEIRKEFDTVLKQNYYRVWRRKFGIWRKYPYSRLFEEDAQSTIEKLKSGELKFPNNKFKRFFIQTIPDTIKSTILCIRFPFLYPRNRFTGTHYNNWKIRDNIKKLTKESVQFNYIPYKGSEKIIFNKRKYYLAKILGWIHDYPLQLLHILPTRTELDAMPSGWRKAFGIEMCKEIRRQLIKDRMLYSYRITQIKEKYGSLRWYDARSSEAIQRIISKYENISYNTCITCGKEATYRTTGWIEPYCDDCINQDQKICAEKIER